MRAAATAADGRIDRSGNKITRSKFLIVG